MFTPIFIASQSESNGHSICSKKTTFSDHLIKVRKWKENISNPDWLAGWLILWFFSSSVYLLVRSFVFPLFLSFVFSFARSSVRSFIRSLFSSLVRSFVRSFIHCFIRSYSRLSSCRFVRLLVCFSCLCPVIILLNRCASGLLFWKVWRRRLHKSQRRRDEKVRVLLYHGGWLGWSMWTVPAEKHL